MITVVLNHGSRSLRRLFLFQIREVNPQTLNEKPMDELLNIDDYLTIDAKKTIRRKSFQLFFLVA